MAASMYSFYCFSGNYWLICAFVVNVKLPSPPYFFNGDNAGEQKNLSVKHEAEQSHNVVTLFHSVSIFSMINSMLSVILLVKTPSSVSLTCELNLCGTTGDLGCKQWHIRNQLFVEFCFLDCTILPYLLIVPGTFFYISSGICPRFLKDIVVLMDFSSSKTTWFLTTGTCCKLTRKNFGLQIRSVYCIFAITAMYFLSLF